MKRIGVLTSGGDTPGMNAAIRSVFKTADYYGMDVLGVYHGYKGLMEGSIKTLSHLDVEDIVHKGGTILRTARSEVFKSAEGNAKARRVIEAFQIEGLVVIGGDGSYNGALSLAKKDIPVMCLPGTIDNDLAYTDFTIGFDTAANAVLSEIYRVRDTMRSHDRYGAIEVMGRACGDIALRAGVAGGVDYIIIPETGDADAFAKATTHLMSQKLRGRTTGIVLLAEGAGSAKELCEYVTAHSDIEIRPIVLGYIQRGGQPSLQDRVIATSMGARAVQLLKDGKRNRAVGLVRNEVMDMDLAEALVVKKKFDRSLYELNGIMARF